MNFRLFSLIILFFSFLNIFCGKEKKISEQKKILDVKWEGEPNSIPKALQNKNPLASEKAKKGGILTLYGHQFPRSLNYYLEQYAITVEIFARMYETLLEFHPATLEPIPHLASRWEISKDKKDFIFYLDENAYWSDGKKITADDVIFTYNLITDKKNDTAIFRIGLSRFEAPIKINNKTVKFRQKEIHWKNFNTVATQLFILPKHYFDKKDFNKQNFEFDVVSGPYKLLSVKKSRYVKLQRRPDYWQRAYPFNQGRYNFDEIVLKMYNDQNVAFQAFKKGEIDIYPVYTAHLWVEETKGKKFENHWIVKKRIYNQKPIGFQGWAMNMRRDIFSDKLTRKAIAYLVDRELMIKKLAYNEYQPTESYFPDFYLKDKRSPNEKIRFDLEKAKELLKKAEWKANTKGILEKNGKIFEFSILIRSQNIERYFTIFIEKLKRVGIIAKIESTDLASWSQKIDKYNFDMTWVSWGQGIFKDPEPQWYSEYANQDSQSNIVGFQSKKVDSLIQKQRTEFSIEKRNEMNKQIDKMIYKEHPYVLLWHLDNTRLLYWNKFSYPKKPLGIYSDESFIYDYWWEDTEKKKKLEKAMKENKKIDE